MLVVVFNDALVRYISRVLPALGVDGVPVVTYEKWAQKLRRGHLAHLPDEYAEDTPAVVVRLKKHPVMLKLIDSHAQAILVRVEEELVDTAKKLEGGARPLKVWRATEGQPVGRRIDAVLKWAGDPGGDAAQLPLRTRHAVERVLKLARTEVRDVVGAWAEILTDRKKLGDAFGAHAPGAFTERELDWAHGHCARRCTALVSWREEEMERERDLAERGSAGAGADDDRAIAVDGEEPEEERVVLDREDDTLLLRLVQRMRGPLSKKNKPDDLRFEHVFVDEAQDLSPVELAVVLDTATERQSVTLAGDVAQRMYRDNGFTEWRGVLQELGLDHVAVEPLRLSYRSTHEIIEFSTEILGPLRNEVEGQATRHGAPVELFKFEDSGEAVGFLSEALRELVRAEPLASVAVITRYPEQADLYHKGLTHGEVPNLRRIAEQDFPFRPGVDVTDVRQVKGLEFDYVILVEVNERSYPADDEARHLLHIAATRAAHQLWVVTTGTASPILPAALVASST
jgi:DNA helicase-2/ATP-dependent DNA helicase PcrA